MFKFFRIFLTAVVLLGIFYLEKPADTIENMASSRASAVVVVEHYPYGVNSYNVVEIGSGFFIEDNLIITAAHVIGNAKKIQIRGITNPKMYDIEVVGIDKFSDIALIKIKNINDFKRTNSYTILKFDSSSTLRLGSKVWSIGHPWDLEWTVTEGIVSSKSRRIDGTVNFLIQTDTKIYQGSSGGPLLNSRGNVVGINDKIIVQQGGSFGFAIPSDLVIKVVHDLTNSEYVKWSVLGVTLDRTADDKYLEIKSVIKESAAEKSGFKPHDILLNIHTSHTGQMGQEIRDLNQFMDEMAVVVPGETVTISIMRDNVQLTIDVIPDVKSSDTMAIIGGSIN